MIDADELRDWLRLLETPLVGRESVRRLLATFGSPQAVFTARPGALSEVVGPAKAAAVAAPASERLDALVLATLAWSHGQGAPGERRHVVTIGDPGYPPALLQTADPPLLLYVQGRVELLAGDSAVAVVGSRNPTPQGAENARAFANALAAGGWTVVSGLALGIDTAAHEGALEASAGGTVAVVGTGLDRVYPKRNLALARRIAGAGAIVSEFPIGTPPMAPHFPMRNRIIAGLAQGTLVVEAALKSGSLSTARQSLEADREVFAVPGSIHSPQSRGCHLLIRQGAKLVETVDDILEELRPPAFAWGKTTGPRLPSTDTLPDPLLAALGFDPASLDALTMRTGRSAADLNVRLLELEIEGRVARLPGQLFQQISTEDR